MQFGTDKLNKDVLKADLKSKEDAIRYAINAGAKEDDIMVNEAMDTRVEITLAGTIKDLDKRTDLTLVTDSQDVQAVREYFGNNDVDEFDGYFVNIEEGDYSEVYGFYGSTPELYKEVYKIEQIMTPTKPETPTWESKKNEAIVNTIYGQEDVRQLFELLYRLEDHLETSGNKNYGLVTQFIQDLNKAGIKEAVSNVRKALEAKFGSVEWQDEQIANIKGKLERGEELSGSDTAFIEIQMEHNKRAEIEELDRMWKASEKKGAAK